MTDRASATPLLALDAVALDTETTSIDPGKARLVELAGVRLVSGHLDAADPFRTLIDPGTPIPETSTRIHGIDTARVAGAPGFAAAWPKFIEFLGGAAVVGYAIDYDFAVLANECRRARLDFHRPRALDVRLLAEVAKPNLSDFSLKVIAAWLGITVEGRHSALGDAITTARIFLALVSHLREAGIRTLAEAESACRKRMDAIAAVGRSGGTDSARPDTDPAFARLDAYPYRHRVLDVMSAPPLFVTPDTTLAAVMQILMQNRVSSVFVTPSVQQAEGGRHAAAQSGIVTERDVLRTAAASGAAALEQPVDRIASRPLAAVPADAFVYRAIGRMSRLKIRHLGVVDEAERVIGALSARDLLRLRASEAVSLGDEIDQAADVHELGRAWAMLPAVAKALLAEGVDARDIAAVISSELRALTRRAAMLGEERMRVAGQGGPPVPYAVLVLGSGGRGESLLAMDQDNAILFAEGAPDGPEDNWFAALGSHIADILDQVGVPYCKGGVMARNAAFRGSVATWRARIAEWFQRSRPEDLLSVDIFFDLRAAHGDGEMAKTLWRDAYERASEEIAFLKVLAEAAAPFQPPLRLFGIKTDNGRVDLKRGGLFALVASARVLALRYRVVARSTRARFEGVKALDAGGEHDLEALIAAQNVLLDAVLRQQLVDTAAGRLPSNAVEVRAMSRAEQKALREALLALKHLDQLVRDLLSGR